MEIPPHHTEIAISIKRRLEMGVSSWRHMSPSEAGWRVLLGYIQQGSSINLYTSLTDMSTLSHNRRTRNPGESMGAKRATLAQPAMKS